MKSGGNFRVCRKFPVKIAGARPLDNDGGKCYIVSILKKA